MCTASAYDVESLAAAVFAHSATTHSRWPLHHCRSALEYEPWRAYWSLPRVCLRSEEHDGSSAGEAQCLGPVVLQAGLVVQTGVVRAQRDHDDIAEGRGIGPRLQQRQPRRSARLIARDACVVQHQRPATVTLNAALPAVGERSPTLAVDRGGATDAGERTDRQRLGTCHQRVADHGDLTAIRAAGTDAEVAGARGRSGCLGELPARHRVSRACCRDANHALEVRHRGGGSRAVEAVDRECASGDGVELTLQFGDLSGR